MTTEEVLKECGAFATLTDEGLRRLAAIASESEFEAGTTIFQEGGKAEELYVIKEGKVALQMGLPAAQVSAIRRITLDIVTGGQMFGWSAIVPPNVYTLSAVCLQRARIVVISGPRLLEFLHESPHMGYEVMKGFIKVVASRLDDTRHVLLSERAFA